MRHARKKSTDRITYGVEALEARQHLTAAPWSAQDQMIGLDQAAQNYPYITGAGETVAIIDHGVDYNHPDLGGGFGPGFKIIDGYDFQDNSGDVFHTYSCYARGIDILNGGYHFLDLAPKGRDENHLEWPQARVRHHDKYKG